jgi:hypothetical protein
LSYPPPEPEPRQYPVPPPLPPATNAAGEPLPDGVPQPMQHGDVSTNGAPSPDGYGTEPWQPRILPDGTTDFTPDRKRPTFKIHGETYYGKIEVPTGPMLKYSARMDRFSDTGDGSIDTETQIRESLGMFRLMLVKESADRFVRHLHMVPPDADDATIERIADEADGDEDAIGFETYMRTTEWLMEQYGMAPTPPSPESSDGSPTSPDDGSRSTESSSEQEPTSSPSPSTEG